MCDMNKDHEVQRRTDTLSAILWLSLNIFYCCLNAHTFSRLNDDEVSYDEYTHIDLRSSKDDSSIALKTLQPPNMYWNVYMSSQYQNSHVIIKYLARKTFHITYVQSLVRVKSFTPKTYVLAQFLQYQNDSWEEISLFILSLSCNTSFILFAYVCACVWGTSMVNALHRTFMLHA